MPDQPVGGRNGQAEQDQKHDAFPSAPTGTLTVVVHANAQGHALAGQQRGVTRDPPFVVAGAVADRDPGERVGLRVDKRRIEPLVGGEDPAAVVEAFAKLDAVARVKAANPRYGPSGSRLSVSV